MNIKKWKNLNKKVKGFTILEIMIAITILGIIGTLSYNPLMDIYNNQQNESQAQNTLNNLRVIKQQAIASQQNKLINIIITKDSNNINTLKFEIPSNNNQLITQHNKSNIILNLNNKQLNNATINISNRGAVLMQNNTSISNFSIIYTNYGIKLNNNNFEKCTTLANSNLSKCN